eukprot:SM000211S06616  [mRNA]  locus=s211:69244:78836:+ [translate_table: standard]
MKLAGLLEDRGVKLKSLAAAAEAARAAAALSPRSVEYAHFHAQLLFELAGDSKGYDEVVRECERALGVDDPVDPAAESLHAESQQELATADARIRHMQAELKGMVQKANIASLSTWMKSLGTGGEEKFRFLQVRKLGEDPMEQRPPPPRRAHEVRKAVKTAEERRQEIEVRVAAARLVQQRQETAGSTQDQAGGGADDDEAPSSRLLRRPGDRRKGARDGLVRRNPKPSQVEEMVARVKPFWKDVPQETRDRLLEVSLADFKGSLSGTRQAEAVEALAEALAFAQEKKTWRFWACCRCGEQFIDHQEHNRHVMDEHVGKLTSKQSKLLPQETDLDWLELINDEDIRPVDGLAAVKILIDAAPKVDVQGGEAGLAVVSGGGLCNQSLAVSDSSNDASDSSTSSSQSSSENLNERSNDQVGAHGEQEKSVGEFSEKPSSRPGEVAASDELEQAEADEGHVANGHICNGDCQRQKRLFPGPDLPPQNLPVVEDLERKKLLEHVYHLLRSMIKAKCLSGEHVHKIVQYAMEEIQTMVVEPTLHVELNPSPLYIRFLDAVHLRNIQKYLMELAQTISIDCILMNSSNVASGGAEKDSNPDGDIIQDRLLLNDDFSMMLIDDRVLKESALDPLPAEDAPQPASLDTKIEQNGGESFESGNEEPRLVQDLVEKDAIGMLNGDHFVDLGDGEKAGCDEEELPEKKVELAVIEDPSLQKPLPLMKVKDGVDAPPHVELQLAWIYGHMPYELTPSQWRQTREEMAQKGLELFKGPLKDMFANLSDLTERKRELTLIQDSLHSAEKLLVEEVERREKEPASPKLSYEKVLQKRFNDLMEINDSKQGGMSPSKKYQCDVIQTLLRESQSTVHRHSYERPLATSIEPAGQTDEEGKGGATSRQEEIISRIDLRVEAALSSQKDTINNQLNQVDAKLLRLVDSLSKQEALLSETSVYDFRSVVLPLLKKFLRDRLEAAVERAAMLKSDKAREAFLAELAKAEGKGRSKEKGSRKVKDLKKGFKSINAGDDGPVDETSSSRLEDGNENVEKEDIEEAGEPVCKDEHEHEATEDFDSQEHDEILARQLAELEAEERKLAEALEMQRRAEENAKLELMRKRQERAYREEDVLHPEADGIKGSSDCSSHPSMTAEHQQVTVAQDTAADATGSCASDTSGHSPRTLVERTSSSASGASQPARVQAGFGGVAATEPKSVAQTGQDTATYGEGSLVTSLQSAGNESEDVTILEEHKRVEEAGQSTLSGDILDSVGDSDALSKLSSDGKGPKSRSRASRGSRKKAQRVHHLADEEALERTAKAEQHVSVGLPAPEHTAANGHIGAVLVSSRNGPLKSSGGTGMLPLITAQSAASSGREHPAGQSHTASTALAIQRQLLDADTLWQGPPLLLGEPTNGLGRREHVQEINEEQFQADLEQAMRQSLDESYGPSAALAELRRNRRQLSTSETVAKTSSTQTQLEDETSENLKSTGDGEVGASESESRRIARATGKGLQNEFGQYNCFLNVVIQSLWHLRHFRERLVGPGSDEHAHQGTPCVVCALRTIFLTLSARQGSTLEPLHVEDCCSLSGNSQQTVAPTALREALSTMYSETQFFQQEQMNDASEVLSVIFDCLHKAYGPSASVLSGEDAGTPESGEDEWECRYQGCIAHTLFGLDIAERMNCSVCGVECRKLKYTAFFHNINASALRSAKLVTPSLRFDELLKIVEQNHQLPCNPEEGGCSALNPIHHLLQAPPHVFTTGEPMRTRMSIQGLQLQRCDDTIIISSSVKASNCQHSALGSPEETVFRMQRNHAMIELFMYAQYFAVLGWQHMREAADDIAATMNAIDTLVDLSVVYKGLSSGTAHQLVSVVCYYGQHYHCFAFYQDLDRWVLFDDSTVKVVGSWEDVVTATRRGHLQPQVLFYEAVS